jgi:hypothetical protein
MATPETGVEVKGRPNASYAGGVRYCQAEVATYVALKHRDSRTGVYDALDHLRCENKILPAYLRSNLDPGPITGRRKMSTFVTSANHSEVETMTRPRPVHDIDGVCHA